MSSYAAALQPQNSCAATPMAASQIAEKDAAWRCSRRCAQAQRGRRTTVAAGLTYEITLADTARNQQILSTIAAKRLEHGSFPSLRTSVKSTSVTPPGSLTRAVELADV